MSAPALELSIALSDNERTRPLLEGRVAPQGIRLVPTMVHPSEMFWRQLRFAEFDVSEMSMSSLIISVARGDTRWVAIPVFTMRKFFHTSIIVRTDFGIAAPADLRGKRIGVPEYQQTWAIWARGILQHEFGVHAREIEWFMERNPDKSHGGATGFAAPEGVRVNQIPPTTDMGEMLVRGELDGALHYLPEQNLVDRSKVDVSGVTRLSVSRSGRRGPPLLRQDRALSDQPHGRGAALAAGEPSLDRAQSLLRLRGRQGGDRALRQRRSCAGISRPACSMTASSARSPPMIRWPTASRPRARCSRPLRNTCTSRGSARAASASTSSSPRAPSTCDRRT